MNGLEATKVRSAYRKFVMQKGKEQREFRARVIRKYMDAIANGKDNQEAQDFCLECFDQEGLTQRGLNGILDKRAEFGNAQANAMTEARMLIWLDKQANMIQEDLQHYDAVLDDIDSRLCNDEEWYPMEEVTIIGKEESVRTKRLPILEVKGIYLKRRAETLDRFFIAIKNLRGNQTVINIDNNMGTSEQSHEALRERIKSLEGQHRVENGVSSEPI